MEKQIIKIHMGWILTILTVMVMVLLMSYPSFAQSPEIEKGVNWLLTNQNPSGSWGDPLLTEFRDTVIAADALKKLKIENGEYHAALQFIEMNHGKMNDTLSWKTAILAQEGRNIDYLVQKLTDTRNLPLNILSMPIVHEGGWGIHPGHGSDILDTAFALSALNAAGIPGGFRVTEKSISSGKRDEYVFVLPEDHAEFNFLITKITGQIAISVKNGSLPDQTTPVYTINTAPIGLLNLPVKPGKNYIRVTTKSESQYSIAIDYLSNGLKTADTGQVIDYLLSMQNPDGGWGIQYGSDSNLFLSAQVLSALQPYAEQFDAAVVIDNGIEWLKSKQNPDGGFGNSPSTVYETALATKILFCKGYSTNEAQNGLNYLLANQEETGSWNKNVYDTGLALMAFWAADMNKPVLNVAPLDQEISAQGGSLTFKVENSGTGLLIWAAQTNDNWIVIEQGRKGKGGGIIKLNIAENEGTERSGTVLVSASGITSVQTIHIQQGQSHPVLSVTPLSQEVDVEENVTSFAIQNLGDGKSRWNAVSNNDWLQIESGASGINSGTINVRYRANQGAERAGTITVSAPGSANSPQTLEIRQAKFLPILAVTPAWQSASAEGDYLLFYVKNQGNGKMQWNAASEDDWLEIVAGNSRMNDGNITVNCKTNLSNDRIGKITIAAPGAENSPQIVEVRQAHTALPDFSIADLSVAPLTVDLHQEVIISAQIVNKGFGDAYQVPVKYYIAGNDEELKIAQVTLDLPAGKTMDHQIRWPANKPGENLNLIVQVDPGNRHKEANEANNSAETYLNVRPSTEPNLTVSHQNIAITPSPAHEAGNAEISAVIRNNGFSGVENVSVEFYRGLPGAGGVLLGAEMIAALSAGESETVSVPWENIQEVGTQIVCVSVDANQQIREFNEEDNLAFVELEIFTLPDLAISAGSIAFEPAMPKEGDPVKIKIRVQNIGQQEALKTTVQVYEGNTLIAAGIADRISGGSQVEIAFDCNTNEKEGSHDIRVVINADDMVLEKYKANNSASRTLSVQNGDCWLTEYYISPNGDGIKDSTQFFFRLKQTQTVQVKVVNSKDKIVKTFDGDEFKNTLGNAVTWDGLDEQGRVVADGQYQFQVCNTNGTVLAMLPVTVDNNRSSLIEAVDTKYLFQNNLTCALPNIDWWQWFPDESGIVFLITQADLNTSGYSEGIYVMSPDGEDIKRIVPAEWCGDNGTEYAYSYNSASLSPDGQKMAFILDKVKKGDGTLTNIYSQVWIIDRYAESRLLLSTINYPEKTWYIDGDISWSPDSNCLFYHNRYQQEYTSYTNYWFIKADGTHNYEIPALKDLDLQYYHWSPDSALICCLDRDGNIYKLDRNGVTTKIFTLSSAGYYNWFDWLGQDRLILKGEQELWLIDLVNGDNNKLLAEETGRRKINYYTINMQDGLTVYTGGSTPTPAFASTGNTANAATMSKQALDADAYIGLCNDRGSCKLIYINNQSSCNTIEELTWSNDGGKLAISDLGHEKTGDRIYAGYIGIYNRDTQQLQWNKVSNNEYPCYGNGVAYESEMNDDEPVKYIGSLKWFDDEHLIAEDSNGVFVITTEQSAQKMYLPIIKQNVYELDPKLSSHRRYITFTQGVNQDSICYGKGSRDIWIMGSLLNLTADLQITKNKNSITLKGTAADLHFESYFLEYALIDRPTEWMPIAPPSDQMALNHVFLEWVPPREGVFLVRLTVRDKAGNMAWDRKRVFWGQSACVSNLYQSAKIFSPNNDKALDTVELYYRVLSPVQLQFEILDGNNARIRTFNKIYTLPVSEDHITWDGRDEYGKIVADGQYRLKLFDYEFPVEVDNTPPDNRVLLTDLFYPNDDLVYSPSPDSAEWLFNALFSRAVDKNLREWSVEIGEGENPPEWIPYRSGSNSLTFCREGTTGKCLQDDYGRILWTPKQVFYHATKRIDFLVGKKIRLTVADQAGNLSVQITDFLEEKLILKTWILPDGVKWPAYKKDTIPDTFIGTGINHFDGYETIRAPILEMTVQGLIDDERWADLSGWEDDFKGDFQFDWDNSRLNMKGVKEIRLKAIDQTGEFHYSNSVRFQPKPLQVTKISTAITYGEAGGCDLPGPDSIKLHLYEENTGDGELFKQMLKKAGVSAVSYYLIKAAGDEILLNSRGLDESDWHTIFIDTRGLADGYYPVRIVFECEGICLNEMIEKINVDRTMPAAVITSPGSDKPCYKLLTNGAYGIHFCIAELSDNHGLKGYEFFYKKANQSWQPGLSWIGQERVPIKKRYENSITYDGLYGFNDWWWDISDLIDDESEISLQLRVTDEFGNRACFTRQIFIDKKPKLTAKLDKGLFSPYFNKAQFSYSLNKPGKIDVKIFKKYSLIKTIAENEINQGETVLKEWDGRDNDNKVVADGEYTVRIFSSTDSCDQIEFQDLPVFVDGTPPTVAITYPQADDLLPVIIEVIGTAADEHFLQYKLFLEASQLNVGQGINPKQDEIIGKWNSFGSTDNQVLVLEAEDRAGNRNEIHVVVKPKVKQTLIIDLSVDPEIFSPNNDGKLDAAGVHYVLNQELQDTFDVGIEVWRQNKIIKTDKLFALPGGSHDWEWKGQTDEGKPAEDDIYSVKLTAQMSHNPTLSQAEKISLVLDTVPPTLAVHPDDQSFIKNPGNFSGSIQDRNIKEYSVAYVRDSQRVVIDQANQNRINYNFTTLELDEGSYALDLYAEDQGSNSVQRQQKFTVDDTPPKVEIKSPASNDVYGNDKDTIFFKGSINDLNLESWSFKYGSGENPAQWKVLVSGTSLPLSENLFDWKIGKNSEVADGLYTLALYAKDKAGWETTVKVKVLVDNTSPLALITVPNEGGYITKPMDIRGTAFDDNIAEYTLEIGQGNCATVYKWTLLKKETKSVKEGALARLAALPPDGSYCLRLKALDKAGYETETKTGIIIDTAPPAAPVLSGKAQNRKDALLSWTANTEPDLAGYNLYRDNQKINSTLIKEIRYFDPELKEGVYHYTVKAVDKAGLESNSSNLVEIKVDLTPPTARISAPSNGSTVNDIVKIMGTAYSEEDFKEYCIYAGQGTEPAIWQMLLRSPVPVSYGKLADWDTITLSEGSYSLKLEAEDLSGNTNVHQVSIAIDNLPPAPPNLIKAEQQGSLASNVDSAWDPSPDADVIGYLVYCNHELANVSGNVIGDLKPYLISGTIYTDINLPDGTFIYYIMAMDEAGNISVPSNSLEAAIDTHAPKVMIAVPKDGHRFENTILVQGETPDLDIKQVQFQYQKPGESAWNNLGGLVTVLPYATYLDPGALGLAYGAYRLRAQGTDLGGRVDANPAEITVYYTGLQVPRNLQARANEGRAMLTWNPNTEADLAGYNVYLVRENQKTKLNGAIVSGTTAYLHGGTGPDALMDAEYVYAITALNASGNESAFSNQAKALVYTPWFEQLYTPSGVSNVFLCGSNVKPENRIDIYISGTSQINTHPIMNCTADEMGRFSSGVTLLPGENWLWAQASDALGNKSKFSEPMVVVYNEPPATPSGLQGTAQERIVHLTWNANMEADLAGYFIYRDKQKVNQTSTVASGTASSLYLPYAARSAFDQNDSTYWGGYLYSGSKVWLQIDLSGPVLLEKIGLFWRNAYYAARDFDIQAWTGHHWLTIKKIRNNFNENMIVELDSRYPTQKIRLNIEVTGSYGYEMRLHEVSLFKANPNAALPQPAFDDPDRPDGEYSYQVSAVDMYGLESPLSTEVKIPVGDVTPPEVPVNLAATSDNADVSLSWTANTEPDLAGYQVYRQSDQGWTKIHSGLVTVSNFKDIGLANGTYIYRVTAVDQIGNESVPSNEASSVVHIAVPQEPFNLQITVNPEGRSLKICWEYNGGSAAGFILYRALAPGGPYVRVNSELIADTCYVDENLLNGVKYYYHVTAVDLYGNEGENSFEQFAIPVDTVAPVAPVLFYPTLTGMPFEAEAADQTLIGFAEQDSAVEFFQDGNSQGKTIAEKSATQQTFSLADNVEQVAVSPDGRIAAYIENGNKLVLLDLNTNETRAVHAGDALWLAGWLPEGRKLCFGEENWSGDSYIVVYDLPTGTKTRLTEDMNAGEYSPSWSRDEKRVAFISNREGGDYKVWVKDMISGTCRNLTDSNGASDPEISPDGSKIVYFKGEELYLADLETMQTEILQTMVQDPWYYRSYRWSPDGKALAFTSYQTGVDELYVRDLQSGAVNKVTDFHADGLTLRGIRWSPEGGALLCSTKKENNYTLWVIAKDGQQKPKLLNDYDSGTIKVTDWISNGQVICNYSIDGFENKLGLIRPPGIFSFTTTLNPGENIFKATARDAAGNQSGPSGAVTLMLPESALPDLSITADTIFVYPAAPINGDQIRIYAVVENKGMAEARDFYADIYLENHQGQWTLLKSEFIAQLDAGAVLAVPLTLEASAYQGSNTLLVMLDNVNQIYELSEQNNSAEHQFFVAAQEGIAMTTVLDAAEYQAESDVSIAITVNNSGPARAVDLTMVIEDVDGAVMHVFDTLSFNLPYGANQQNALKWNTGLVYAGTYRVRAILKDVNIVFNDQVVPFEILPEMIIHSELMTDKFEYAPNEDIFIQAAVLNAGRNYDISLLKVTSTISDQAGDIYFSEKKSINDLAAGGSVVLPYLWNTGSTVSGPCRIITEIMFNDKVVSGTFRDFRIIPIMNVAGDIKIIPEIVDAGNGVQVNYSINNTGNIKIENLKIKVMVIDPKTTAIIDTRTKTINLDIQGIHSDRFDFSTIDYSLQTYQVLFQCEGRGIQKDIAKASFTVSDRTSPIVVILSPADGGLFHQPFELMIQCRDTSGIKVIEYKIDGGKWTALPTIDPFSGLYAIAWIPTEVEEGPHTIWFRASDRAGNVSEPVATSISIVPRVDMTMSLNAEQYSMNEDVGVKVNLTNIAWAKNVTLKVDILNSDGTVIHDFDPLGTVLEIDETRNLDFTWNTGLNPAGSYKVRAVLIKGGSNLAEKVVPFLIQPVLKFNSGLITDKAHYGLKENVILNLNVTNIGNSAAALLNLKLKIRPEGGQDVFVKELSLMNLIPNQPTDLVENWNTNQYPAGNYQTGLDVYLGAELVASSETGFSIDPVPMITGTLEITPLKINLGEDYQTGYSIRNEGNVVAQDLPVKILVFDNGQSKTAEQQALITLGINETGTGVFTFSSQGYTPGLYQAVLQTFLNGADHELGRKTLEIVDDTQPFEKLTGTLQAVPNPVYLGLEEGFQYVLRNEATQALSGLTVKTLVIDPDTQEIRITLSEQIDLPAKGIHTATLKTATDGLALKTYQAVLQIEMSGKEPRKLAETSFEVVAGLDATKSLVDEIRLLVWVNDHCPSSCRSKEEYDAGKDHEVGSNAEASCHAWLKNEISLSEPLQNELRCDPNPCKECLDLDLLKVILDQVADHYKIVFSPCAFADELRNPLYSDILILGDHQPLQDHMAAELRERVHSGTGLISSQWLKHGCSAAYDEVCGITYKGMLSHSDPMIETVQSPVTTPGTFKTIGKAYNIKTDPDTLIAGWIKTESKWKHWDDRDKIMCPDPQGPHAALVLHDYGQGRTIYHAFDLGRSLQEGNTEWIKNLLKNSLGYIHKTLDPQELLTPYELVPVNLGLTNSSVGFITRIKESFPKEIGLYDPITKQWIDESPWIFDIDLGSGGEKDIRFYYLTPDEAGIYQTQTDVSMLLNNEPVLVKQLELDLAITKDLDQILDETINRLKALSLPPPDQARVKNALAALNKVKVKTVRTRCDVDYIIKELVRAIDYLRNVKSASMADHRLELDRLMRSYEVLYYLFVPPGEYLQGGMEISPNPAKTNQELNVHVILSNDSHASFKDLKVKVLIMDPQSRQIVKILEKPLILEGDSRQEFDLKAVIKSFKAKTYKVLLRAYSGLLPEPKVLAEGDLTITAQ